MAEGKKAMHAAIIGHGLIAITKFVAAGVRGSSAMLAEGIHSVVDTANGGVLILGLRRGVREPDDIHPFGWGGTGRTDRATVRCGRDGCRNRGTSLDHV